MNCKNCNTLLLEKDQFCNHCGGKIIKNKLTFKNLLESFSEQFLNYDNKFLQTFKTLFSKPEDVIGSYINGTRKKYVNVISYFAIAITISGLQLFILNKFFPEVMDISNIVTEGAEEVSQKNMKIISDYQSLFMMLYVPFYAIIARLVFLKNKKFNFTEITVMFMYILAQISLIGAVLTLIFAIFGITLGTITVILFPIQIVYSAYCLKGLYNLSIKSIVLKTLLFFLVLFLILIALMIIFIVFGIIYYGGLKEFGEAQRAVSYLASSSINWTS